MEVVDPRVFSLYKRELTHQVGEAAARMGYSRETIDSVIVRRLQRTRGEAFAALIDEHVQLRGKRVLDVGSGFGELVVACLARGADAEGLDPDEARVHVSTLLLDSFGLPHAIQVASGEALPFPDCEFDLVTSQHVLEHVADIDAVVSEMVRVTRPGGFLFVSVPNYLFPYEGHYKMKWFPLTPKPVGKLILRLRGRDPHFFLNHVQYTTYPRMIRLWRRHGLQMTNLTRARLMAGKHESQIYKRWVLRALVLKLNLFPTVTWMLKKSL